jgi:hypothetical protein
MCPQRLICTTSVLGSNGSRLIGHSVFNGRSMSENKCRVVSVNNKLGDMGKANEDAYVGIDVAGAICCLLAKRADTSL